jgi:putative transcriptional regulator
MAQILKSKNLATKFQIMMEIAAHQPNIHQKDIAQRLGITSQAVSEYMKELIKDGWLSFQGRSQYKVTRGRRRLDFADVPAVTQLCLVCEQGRG